MIESQVAAAVVLNPQGQVLVVNQNGDSWSLPKGHVDPGESLEQAVVREIYEESGVREVTLVKKLGNYSRPRIGRNGNGDDRAEMKHITVFLAKTDQIELEPQDVHNPEARWVELDDVSSLLTHQKDREFFESVTTEVRRALAE